MRKIECLQLIIKLLFQSLNCADKNIAQFGGFSYARSALQLFSHFLVFLLLCFNALIAVDRLRPLRALAILPYASGLGI